MDKRVIVGNHRFTCLSPTLVRIEFAPDGWFEPRRSIVAYAQQKPIAFKKLEGCGNDSGNRGETAKEVILDTGSLQIRASAHDQAFDRLNLEVRWSDGRLMQFWRPDDRDYQNLGGTLRSLDGYRNEAAELDGVHPATMESPDVGGTNWPSWIRCEVEPLYAKLHTNPPLNLNQRDWLLGAMADQNDGSFPERSFNWNKVARKFSPGVLSASGYYFLNDSASAVMDSDDFPVERNRPGYQDWYFFAYGKDYKQALKDFRLLSGPAPIPTHKTFGIIFSRWPAFSQDEIKAMAKDFKVNGYALSTLVMDMEWHKEGWGHWEFDPKLIPNPKRFFALCRKHGLDITFNDHPLDVREDDAHFAEYVKRAGPDVLVRQWEYKGKTLNMAKVDICNKQQNQAFREVCHQELMDLGLDYWWNDGSRGQMSGTCGQLVTNKTFFEESEREGRRGMMLARYGGLGSHRYGGFFTGDANSDYYVLKTQCEFNIRAGGVGISNVSHDIGGFMISSSQLKKNKAGEVIIDPERYLRWMQFGVFGPILRFHSAPSCGSRKPYDYDTEVGGACRHWLRVRHSLLPYIYSAARIHHDTGIPMVRGMYLEEPENPQAYRFDQYYFGPDMLVAPMLSSSARRTVYLPKGEWWEFETARRIVGGVEITRPVALAEMPVYIRAGGIIPRQDPDGDIHAAHVERLMLDVYPHSTSAAGSPVTTNVRHADSVAPAVLYEDDGRSPDYKQGKFCRTQFELRQDAQSAVISGRVIEGIPLGKIRQITIDISLDPAPRKVTFAGKTLKTVACENGRYRIRLPKTKAAEKWELRIVV